MMQFWYAEIRLPREFHPPHLFPLEPEASLAYIIHSEIVIHFQYLVSWAWRRAYQPYWTLPRQHSKTTHRTLRLLFTPYPRQHYISVPDQILSFENIGTCASLIHCASENSTFAVLYWGSHFVSYEPVIASFFGLFDCTVPVLYTALATETWGTNHSVLAKNL